MGSVPSKTIPVIQDNPKNEEKGLLYFDFSPTHRGAAKGKSLKSKENASNFSCLPLKKSFLNCSQKFFKCSSSLSLFSRRIKKKVLDKIKKKCIDDAFFKHNVDLQKIAELDREVGTSDLNIYSILHSEYVGNGENDLDFLNCLHLAVIDHFILKKEGIIFNDQLRISVKNLIEWADILDKDLLGKRFIEEECFDKALRLFKKKDEASNFDITDYHRDLSHILGLKLLQNGVFFGKEISLEELEAVKINRRMDFLKQRNLLDHTLESLVELFNTIKKQLIAEDLIINPKNNDKKENGEIPRSKTINKIVNLKTLEIDNPNPVYPVEDEEKNKDENEEVDHEKEENMTKPFHP